MYFWILGPKGGLAEKVADEVDGKKIMFANQMDTDEEEDAIYFNDSSDTYHFGDVFYAFLCGEKTGRAIRYDKKTKKAKVVMDHLHFPNGLALSKDGSFVLSCEVPTQFVHRYWAKGPKAGTRDIFAKLPGYADNIRRTETWDFWVALHSKKTPFSRRKAACRRRETMPGEVLEILEDSERKNMKFVSEVQERYVSSGLAVWVCVSAFRLDSRSLVISTISF
ncbi:unnamed protein product [Microthlaspi erraticum]|uniref:Strictosidine synthase conserved region domain-containing protein n=1 Tax=Microthlaspi erraticum TaxID=1685480 RepID=A0A6D2JSP0_9BRAS|nr:unnamed protein product [Microthlaspi erraticum]